MQYITIEGRVNNHTSTWRDVQKTCVKVQNHCISKALENLPHHHILHQHFTLFSHSYWNFLSMDYLYRKVFVAKNNNRITENSKLLTELIIGNQYSGSQLWLGHTSDQLNQDSSRLRTFVFCYLYFKKVPLVTETTMMARCGKKQYVWYE